ncbi:MAG: ABC-type uncharacterized transport system involved in gliding motility auxiliary subunit [Oleiphilaceae bacterium]|jgi:ABC-type uncharacterized transport system involved in gliding motility auxiliary subunit
MKLIASPKVLIVVFLLMFLTIIISSKYLVGVRLDLSESGLYTLSAGTKKILKGLDQPVTLSLYFSEKASSQLPALRTYAQRVEELLEEYVGLSNGKITFIKIDPIPFSESEDEAALAGLQGVPIGAQGDEIYFGLVAKNEADAQDVIAFMQPDREAYLEYELTRLISSLSAKKMPTVGIYSGIEINGGYDYRTRQARPAWAIMEYIEEGFDVEWIEEDVTEIMGVDVLLLIAPQNLSESLLFAIDQFVLGGGRTLIFVDPHAETIGSQGQMPSVQRADLSRLLPGWGIAMRDDVIVTDFANSMVVGVGESRNPVRHIGLLSMASEALSGDDIVLHGLESLNFSSAGILDKIEGGTTNVTPLILSSDQAQPQNTSLLLTLDDPQDLLNDFTPTGERYTLAARVSGPAKTAFPEGIQIEVPQIEDATAEDAVSEEEAGMDTTQASEETETKLPVMETLSPKLISSDHIRLMVVADTDVLSDRLWVQVQNFFGQQVVSPWADNGSLLVNSLENFSGHPDLIEIRSQGRFKRPFTKVETLRLRAEERFLEQQELLEEELKAAEVKMLDLERLREGGDGAMFSAEQELELKNFQAEKLKIRKQLRDVQHQLDQDIENLGTSLKLINIFFIPLCICLLVLLAAMRRRLAK